MDITSRATTTEQLQLKYLLVFLDTTGKYSFMLSGVGILICRMRGHVLAWIFLRLVSNQSTSRRSYYKQHYLSQERQARGSQEVAKRSGQVGS